MHLKKNKLQSGFGIVESLIASLILLFVLSSGFILLNSVLVNITLENKKYEIASILDERVNIYRLTGVFDDTKTEDGIRFIKTEVFKEEINADSEEKEDDKKDVDKNKPLSFEDLQKIVQKADEQDKKDKKDTDNNVHIVYKIINIAAIDDQLNIAERVKIVEREVTQDDDEKQ
ncbi:MAG: hypothetical protein Kow0076_0550 [Francisella sp.]